MDVTDEKAVSCLVKKVGREKPSLDAVLNNAGIAAMNHFLLTPGRTIEKVFNKRLRQLHYMRRLVKS